MLQNPSPYLIVSGWKLFPPTPILTNRGLSSIQFFRNYYYTGFYYDCKYNIYLATNPFYDAYLQSDYLGKLIFIGLVLLSVISWIIMLYKGILTYRARKFSLEFYSRFHTQKANPLVLECDQTQLNKKINPFLQLYIVLKKHTLDILNKNRHFSEGSQKSAYLSPSDVEFVEMQLLSSIAKQTKDLEKNLFILSTVVSLGPFLGLLGTVWGILTTFSHLQAASGGSTNQMVLGGISLALATTVLGLIDAIPALIGYNYLKNEISSLSTDMEGFSTEILAAVEMHYRKVDVA